MQVNNISSNSHQVNVMQKKQEDESFEDVLSDVKKAHDTRAGGVVGQYIGKEAADKLDEETYMKLLAAFVTAEWREAKGRYAHNFEGHIGEVQKTRRNETDPQKIKEYINQALDELEHLFDTHPEYKKEELSQSKGLLEDVLKRL